MSDKHIFISYSRNDGEPYVSELENRLEVAGYAIWRDKRDLRPDQDFTADIERGIEAASHVVVCLTPDTKRNNSFVRREIQYALAIKRPVIPVRCADIPPQVSIINNEWVDYFRNPDNAITRLLEIVSNSDYTNKPSDATDPFRPYLEEALKFIVDGLDQRIIRLIDLKAAPKPDAVNFAPPPERTSIFKQAFSGVKKTEPEKPPQNFETFQEGFKLYNERALLLGQPGAGKTITLMAHARDAYAARLADPTQPLPLFGLVATWNPKTKPPLADWLAESLNLDPQLFRAEIDAGRTLLLLDGLDELRAIQDENPAQSDLPSPTGRGAGGEGKSDPRRDFLDALPSNNRILLTCRIEDYAEIGQKANLSGAITLRDLTAEQVQTYLADQPHLLKLIESDPHLRELTQTPLLLSIFAFAYQDMTDAERIQLKNIDSTGELRDKIFIRYIDQRYAHEAAKIGADLPLTLEELKDALGRLAIQMGFSNMIGKQEIENAKVVPNVGMVFSLAEQLHLLALSEGENYRFVHLLLHNTFAFPQALIALSDSDIFICCRAAKILAWINDSRAIDPLINALSNPDSYVRTYIVDALRDFGKSAMNSLIVALKDTNKFVRRSAADLLKVIGDAGVIEPLINALLHDLDWSVRHSAAVALGHIGDERAVDPLINALQDKDQDVRSKSNRALISIGLPAVNALILTLRNSNTQVISYTADALGHIGDKRAVDPLINALQDPNENVRRSAADALMHLKDIRAVEPLISALRDPNENVRRSAADALGHIGDERAIEPLISVLQDQSAYVRSRAADILGEFKDVRAVPELIKALKDREGGSRNRVCDAAAWALKTIGTPEAIAAADNFLLS